MGPYGLPYSYCEFIFVMASHVDLSLPFLIFLGTDLGKLFIWYGFMIFSSSPSEAEISALTASKKLYPFHS